MRIARRNWALGAVLLVLLGAQATLRLGGTAEREVGPLLPGLEGAEVTRVVVEEGAPGARRRLSLEREEGGGWRLEEHAGYPAYDGLVDMLVDRLRGLTTLDLLSEDSASHAEYGVDETGTRMSFFGTGGTPLAVLVQGEESTGGRASYVRREDGDAVYRAPHLRRITTAEEKWIESRLIGLRPELIDTIRLRGSDLDADLVLTRGVTRMDNWTTGTDGIVAAAAVNSLLSRAQGLFIGGVEGAFDAGRFGPDRLALTIVERGGRTLEARIGADVDGGRTLAAARDGTWIVTVPTANVKLLLEAARALR